MEISDQRFQDFPILHLSDQTKKYLHLTIFNLIYAVFRMISEFIINYLGKCVNLERMQKYNGDQLCQPINYSFNTNRTIKSYRNSDVFVRGVA